MSHQHDDHATSQPRQVAVGDTGAVLADYLTEPQLAEQLGRTVRTLRTWRARGEGPPITRVGLRIYYNREDVRQWLRSQRVKAA